MRQHKRGGVRAQARGDGKARRPSSGALVGPKRGAEEPSPPTEEGMEADGGRCSPEGPDTPLHGSSWDAD